MDPVSSSCPAQVEPVEPAKQAVASMAEGEALPLAKRHRWLAPAVVGWAVVIYVLVYVVLRSRVSSALYTYVLNPALWGSLAAVAWVGWRWLPIDRPRASRPIVFIAILIGAAQVAVSLIAGVLSGFGRSPYNHALLPLLGGLFYAGTLLIGQEMSRAYLLAVIGGRRPFLALVMVSFFVSAISATPARYSLLADPRGAMETAGGFLLPTIAENVLASFLALVGGPLPTLAYRGTMQLFEWLSPILPRLDWPVKAFVGTLGPVLGILATCSVFSTQKPEAEVEPAAQGGQSGTAPVIIAVVAVALLWFNTGILGIQPILVGSGSMSPTIKVGDVVLIKQAQPESIVVGDVIRYNRQGLDVIHRVVAIQEGPNGPIFITRGDANNTDDAPVEASALKGKVLGTIPKVGWIAIGLRQGISWLGSLLG